MTNVKRFTILCIVVLACLLIAICASVVKCNPDTSSLSEAVGTYYFFNSNSLNKDYYLQLNSDGTGEIRNYDSAIPFTFTLSERGHRFLPVAISQEDAANLPKTSGVRDGVICTNIPVKSVTEEGIEETNYVQSYFCKEDVKSPYKEYENLYYAVGKDGYYSITGVVDASTAITLTIPRFINHVMIRTIANNALWGCKKLDTIIFNGSKEQWNDIYKEKYWDSGTNFYTIQCTNGDIKKGR